jgi:hypothetical protein
VPAPTSHLDSADVISLAQDQLRELPPHRIPVGRIPRLGAIFTAVARPTRRAPGRTPNSVVRGATLQATTLKMPTNASAMVMLSDGETFSIDRTWIERGRTPSLVSTSGTKVVFHFHGKQKALLSERAI